MDKYLFKTSLKVKGVPISYSTSKSKPMYLVAINKSDARDMANKHIRPNLEIKSISCIAVQCANIIFSGDYK